jgi:hypothetical protein
MGGTIEASKGDETMKQEDVRYALSVALNQLHELRDKFAMSAVNSLASGALAGGRSMAAEEQRIFAETAYVIADAMLRAKFKEMQ